MTTGWRHGGGNLGRLRLLAVAGLLALVTLHDAAPAAAAADKSFTIESLDTEAVVRANGAMEVTELVTYRFDGGPFTIGVRSFESGLGRIADFRAFEVRDGEASDAPLQVDPPSATPTGQWEFHFAEPLTDTARTFELRYRVDDAVELGPDVGELYWQFVGRDHPGIGSMSVRVEIPGDAPPATPDVADSDASVVRAFAHGPASGQIELAPGLVTATVGNVPAAQFVELRILVPAAAFDFEPTGGPRLAGVLDEERSFIDGDDSSENRRDLGRLLGPLGAAAALLVTGIGWARYGRDPKPSPAIGRYWREPLEHPPVVEQLNLGDRGALGGDGIAATLIDLAQRGYLRITAEHHERIGPDRTVHTFHWLGRDLGDDVLAHERALLEMVLRGQPSMSSDELTDWAKANRKAAAKELAEYRKLVKAEFERRPWSAKMSRPAVVTLVIAVAVAALSGVAALALGSRLGYVALAAIPLVLGAGAKKLHNRTQEGADEAARATGMRDFLRDFSNLEEAPVGHLVLWERYLVWAVALGVAGELIAGLATRLPQLAQDPSFGAFYIGPVGHFDGLDDLGATGGQITTSFTPPSSSGSGGGFSGGGGGGGGGGGFGAR